MTGNRSPKVLKPRHGYLAVSRASERAIAGDASPVSLSVSMTVGSLHGPDYSTDSHVPALARAHHIGLKRFIQNSGSVRHCSFEQ